MPDKYTADFQLSVRFSEMFKVKGPNFQNFWPTRFSTIKGLSLQLFCPSYLNIHYKGPKVLRRFPMFWSNRLENIGERRKQYFMENVLKGLIRMVPCMGSATLSNQLTKQASACYTCLHKEKNRCKEYGHSGCASQRMGQPEPVSTKGPCMSKLSMGFFLCSISVVCKCNLSRLLIRGKGHNVATAAIQLLGNT